LDQLVKKTDTDAHLSSASAWSILLCSRKKRWMKGSKIQNDFNDFWQMREQFERTKSSAKKTDLC